MGRAKVIGIAGTAKNTGKTTTTSPILEEGYRRQRTMAVTSIGYDGEELDNVTGLPKPRIFLREGTWVAVAKKCLEFSTASIQVLQDTQIKTPLGSIVIGVVQKPGLVVVAGPNKASEVRGVVGLLKEHGASLILVDGALNRMAPMIETEGIILATGVARTTDVQRLTKETEALDVLFGLPGKQLPLELSSNPGVTLYWQEQGKTQMRNLAPNVLFGKESAQALAAQIREQWLDGDNRLGVCTPGKLPSTNNGTKEFPKNKILLLQALANPEALQTLLVETRGALKECNVLFHDPVRLYLAGDPLATIQVIEQLKASGAFVGLVRPLPLLAVTVNPFYPNYHADSQSFTASFLPKGLLERKLRQVVDCPVLNLKVRGVRKLWRKTVGF